MATPRIDPLKPARLPLDVSELLEDPTEARRWLLATKNLTDEATEASIHDLGFRLALWTMRSAALRGDYNTVRACDVYLKRYDTFKASQSGPKREPDRNVSASSSFLPASRQETTEEPRQVIDIKDTGQ